MQKKKKRTFAALLTAILVVALTGCSKLGSIINEIHGSLIGNNYTVYTYDNYGNQTLKTSGKKISITGNKIETVSYDSNGGNGITDNAALARVLNRYKNDFGKSRVVVIKSQLGQPIAAFSGDNVYWEIPDDLPKMTKLMVDGKALYIHRANYQIIDKDLL